MASYFPTSVFVSESDRDAKKN